MMTNWDEMPRNREKSVDEFLWHDEGWLRQQTERYTSCCPSPLNVYELDPDTWMRGESGAPLSYHRLADELAPYAKQMGYTHVLLPYPVGRSDGDLRDFVDIMHTAGVGVLVEGASDADTVAYHLDGALYQGLSDVLVLHGGDASYPRNNDWAALTLASIQCDLYDGSRRRELLLHALNSATPNGVLAVSRRDVSEGNRSFLSKMPGDYWQKFAGVRLFAAWMMTCPGVKQGFMGTEIGQFDEWNADTPMQWFLLDYDYHARLQHYFAALSSLYLSSPALWQSEARVMEGSVDDGVLVFVRPSDKGDIVVILNLTPRAMEGRAIRVPTVGTYREIFNSDASEFGGSHVVNTGSLRSEDRDGVPTLTLRIPPLACAVLCREDCRAD